jgi:hypothetical protein
MKPWLKMGAVGLLGVAVGWVAAQRTVRPKLDGCFQAVQILSKGAPLERLGEATKAMAAE